MKMICDETSSSGGSTSGVGPGDLRRVGRVGRVGVASRLRAMARLARSLILLRKPHSQQIRQIRGIAFVLDPPVRERLHPQRMRQVHVRSQVGQRIPAQYQPYVASSTTPRVPRDSRGAEAPLLMGGRCGDGQPDPVLRRVVERLS